MKREEKKALKVSGGTEQSVTCDWQQGELEAEEGADSSFVTLRTFGGERAAEVQHKEL